MATFVHVKGFEALDKALAEFPTKLFKSAVRRALYAGAKVIAAEAKANCPVGPPSQVASHYYGAKAGALRRSIRAGTRANWSRGQVVGYVKAGATPKNLAPFYAHFVEYGTAAHFIFPRKGPKVLKIAGKFAAYVPHGGAVEKPFMRPAFHRKQAAAIEAVRLSLLQSINQNMKGNP